MPAGTAALEEARGRLNRILAPEGIEVDEVFRERSTHFTFLGTARRPDYRGRVWGKLYKRKGVLRQFQRVFFPAYAKGQWEAMRTLREKGIAGPRPILYKKLSSGLLPVGAVVVAEFIPGLKSLAKFALALPGPRTASPERRAMAEAVGTLAGDLHRAGVFHFKKRYLHYADNGRGRTLYVCDMDKVLLAPRAPGILRHAFRIRDLHGLYHTLGKRWTEEERGLFFKAYFGRAGLSPRAERAYRRWVPRLTKKSRAFDRAMAEDLGPERGRKSSCP